MLRCCSLTQLKNEAADASLIRPAASGIGAFFYYDVANPLGPASMASQGVADERGIHVA